MDDDRRFAFHKVFIDIATSQSSRNPELGMFEAILDFHIFQTLSVVVEQLTRKPYVAHIFMGGWVLLHICDLRQGSRRSLGSAHDCRKGLHAGV